MRTYTDDELVGILKDCDYPTAMIPKITRDLKGLSDEARLVFAKWEATRNLRDDAFDIAGVTPKVLRAKHVKLTDVAIILVYDHLVKCVKREFDYLVGAKAREARKQELEKKMALAIFASNRKADPSVRHC